MFNNDIHNKLKELSNEEVKILSITNDDKPFVYFAKVKMPYSKEKYIIQFGGMEYEQLRQSLVENINQQLEDMIDHLGDCKL